MRTPGSISRYSPPPAHLEAGDVVTGDVPPAAADAKVDLAHDERLGLVAPPPTDERRRRPRLEHQCCGSVERSLDHDLEVATRGDDR
jgi:hypothetical protein